MSENAIEGESELDRLAPPVSEIKLSNGTLVEIERLRTRQFFKLLKILTSGAGALLNDYRLDGNLTAEEFQARLLALVVLAVPEAEEEAMDFLRSMVVPSGLKTGRQLSSADKAHNDEIIMAYNDAMTNPELEDTIEIIETIVRNEAADMQRLGKRLMQMAEKTGQIKRVPGETTSSSETATPQESSEDIPEPSTS